MDCTETEIKEPSERASSVAVYLLFSLKDEMRNQNRRYEIRVLFIDALYWLPLVLFIRSLSLR